MRKLAIVVGVVLMAASGAQAMTAGPGGRLYFTYWDGDPSTADNVVLKSILISTDWVVQNAEGVWDEHGVIYNDITNAGHTGTNRYYPISPEIYKPGGTTLGAYGSLMMGVGYKGDPANTMSLLEIQPSAGGNTVTVVGVGKAISGTDPHTTYGFIGAPDPAGGFTGSPSAFVVTSSTSSQGDFWLHIVQDGADAGTDPMNDNAEYIDSINGSGVNGFGNDGLYDFEIAGNRIYMNSTSWSAGTTPPVGNTGIGYYERTTNTLTKQWFAWRDPDKMRQVAAPGSYWWTIPYDTDGDNIVWTSPGTTSATSMTWDSVKAGREMGQTYEWNPRQGLNTQGARPFAAGKVLSNTPGYEGYRDAVWAVVSNGGWQAGNWYTENVTGSTRLWQAGGATDYYIAMFCDLDGDGYAMDNTIGEVTYIVRQTDTGLPSSAANWAGLNELELVQNPADNKLFLIGLNTTTAWYVGRALFVLDLEDNGDWAGGAQMLLTERQGATYTLWSVLGRAIEFDATQIPEPGTLLLLGTSALGLISYIRRRRMK